MNGMDLKLKRVQACLTQYELGKLAGLRAARISEMETGKRPIIQAVVDVLSHEMGGAGRERPE